MENEEHFHTIVIGGGQAGLAAAYYLSRLGVDFVVLEAQARLGEPWRKRWDSLRLFTPSKFNGLPGMQFPRADFYFPTKDEVGQYIQDYAERFHLPIRLNAAVNSLSQSDGHYCVTAGPNSFLAKNVIVATGAYQQPVIPTFAQELNPGIVQLHSSEYRNPEQVPDGNVLVVGAGNSGAEIAVELAASGRKVWLSGRNVGRIPADTLGRIFGGRPYWFFISHVLSQDTRVGRKVRAKALHQGTPLIRLAPNDVTNAGVTRCPRMNGSNQGLPCLEDGRVLDVKSIVWATGFRNDFTWIQLPIIDARGYPLHDRGTVLRAPGVYFVGLHFQTALSSSLLGGVGVDAKHVVQRIGALSVRQTGVVNRQLRKEAKTDDVQVGRII